MTGLPLTAQFVLELGIVLSGVLGLGWVLRRVRQFVAGRTATLSPVITRRQSERRGDFWVAAGVACGLAAGVDAAIAVHLRESEVGPEQRRLEETSVDVQNLTNSSAGQGVPRPRGA